MDINSRLRIRKWKGYGEPLEQSAAIMDGIRYGLLDYKMVQLAAFLGHEASRLVAYDTKPSGIVINNTLLRNSDMGELTSGISYFGSRALGIFNLGLVRMAFAERKSEMRKIRNNQTQRIYWYPETNVVYLPNWIGVTTYYNEVYGEVQSERQQDTYDTNSGIDATTWYRTAELAALGRKESIKELKSYRAPNNNRGYGHNWSVNTMLPKIVLNLAHEGLCNERNRAKVLKYCNGFYDDEVILKYTREQVLPWALGEFYEGTPTPAFLAYRPFVSSNTKSS